MSLVQRFPAAFLGVTIGLAAFFGHVNTHTISLKENVRPTLAPSIALSSSARPFQIPSDTKGRQAYGRLPLAFVRNVGQVNPRVRYLAQTSGATFYFLPREIRIALVQRHSAAVSGPMRRLPHSDFSTDDTSARGLALALRFEAANQQVIPEGVEPGGGTVNYLTGKDPAKWHTGLSTFNQVVYRDLWPGIDMAIRGDSSRLKYEFVVRPGARVADIRLAYDGVERLSIDTKGNLTIRTRLGSLTDSPPVSYQEIAGRHVTVKSRYLLKSKTYSFEMGGRYDPAQPLVIDPGLVYSTFLGGTNGDVGGDIAVDAAGSAYVTGSTASPVFPTTVGAYAPTRPGSSDAFVVKLNPTGSALVYATYLGGSDLDRGLALAVDASGRAYVTGYTYSSDFPVISITPPGFTPSTLGTTFNGGGDVFVSKLNPAGSALLYSTFLGGSSQDTGWGIAVDAFANAYVTGETGSSNFPITQGVFQPSSPTGGGFAGFITKIDTTSGFLWYSSYIQSVTGVWPGTISASIAVDSTGKAYVAGGTTAPNFMGVSSCNPVKSVLYTTYNAFVISVNPSGSSLIYAICRPRLNASAWWEVSQATAIAVDSSGSAYVTGSFSSSQSGGLPTQADIFVEKLSSSGSFLYRNSFGGTGWDEGSGIAIDKVGQAYITGATDSTDFPVTSDAFASTNSGQSDVFVSKLDASGANLVYSTYLGGIAGERFDGLGIPFGLCICGSGPRIAVDSARDMYITGETASGGIKVKTGKITSLIGAFPTTPGAYDTSFNGGNWDVFVTKLSLGGPIFSGTFTRDQPGAPPAGAEVGTWAINDPAGTIHVVDAAGNLTDKPVELTQFDSAFGGVALQGTVAGDAPASGVFGAHWQSLVSSSTATFGAIVLRDSSGRILAALEYRPNGQITFDSSAEAPFVTVGAWTQGVAQTFDLTVNLTTKTVGLRINGEVASAAQNVPFLEPLAANLSSISFELGGTSAQAFAWDDIEIDKR